MSIISPEIEATDHRIRRNPILTEEAKQQFTRLLRRLKERRRRGFAEVFITARRLEALVRLAKASAPMRLSKSVTLDDAKRVIQIVEG